MAYWLIKSEPDAFSWEDQVRNKTEPWNGVRNHLAKRNLMSMKKGDLAFFYHSNIGREIVGIVQVVKEYYKDPTAGLTDPWVTVDVEALQPLPRKISLAEMKSDPALSEMVLLRQSRLSVCPVSAAEWAHICQISGVKPPLLKTEEYPGG